MIRIIHGDNSVESRKQLSFFIEGARKKGQEVIRIDGGTSLPEILTTVRSLGLFSREKLVVVEDFFSTDGGGRGDGLKSKLAGVEGDVIFWEGGELSGKKLNDFSKITSDITNFEVSKEIFKFLDSLAPQNVRVSFPLLTSVLSAEPIEFLLYMIGRQIRLLLWAKLDPDSLILASWQKAKILNQGRLWSESQLRDFHSKLVQLDRGNKQSQLAVDPATSLELLLAGIVAPS